MKILSYTLVPTRHYDAAVSQQAMELCENMVEEMGAELHDDLIQKLSVFQLLIDRMERATHNPEECQALCIKMRSEFQAVVHAVRSISRQWMPVRTEDQSFDEQLKTLCQNMEHPGASHIHYTKNGQGALPDERSTRFLLRIVQELMHNALRHSAAWHIWVTLTWEPGRLLLEVEDDGTHVTRLQQAIDRLQSKHNTLRMRALSIGAQLRYEKGKKGLLARVELPL